MNTGMITATVRRLSPWELYIAHKSKGHVEDVIATIDLEGFMNLQKSSRQRTKTLNAIKYFNLKGYMNEHMKRALSLKLENANKAVLLDIGTGFGYFPYICEFFGNTSVAIDVPNHDLFNDVTDFLGIHKIQYRIEALAPLPKFEGKFDLVTAFQVAFNRHDRERPWGEAEGSFFLADVFDNVLNSHSQIMLDMNWDPVSRNWLSPGARQALSRYRTRSFGNRVRVQSH